MHDGTRSYEYAIPASRCRCASRCGSGECWRGARIGGSPGEQRAGREVEQSGQCIGKAGRRQCQCRRRQKRYRAGMGQAIWAMRHGHGLGIAIFIGRLAEWRGNIFVARGGADRSPQCRLVLAGSHGMRQRRHQGVEQNGDTCQPCDAMSILPKEAHVAIIAV